MPEASQLKFRSARKQSDQTHVEFARVQEQLLDRWLTSKNVGQNFAQFRQLMLVEQFKQCIHADIRTHLNERDINNIHDAATIADDYFITLKLSASNYGGSNRSSQNYRGQNYRPPQSKSPHTQSTREGNTQSSPSGQGKGPSSSGAKTSSGDGFKSSMTCNFCKKPRHLITSCWKLKAKQKSSQESAPTGCAVSMRRSGSS